MGRSHCNNDVSGTILLEQWCQWNYSTECSRQDTLVRFLWGYVCAWSHTLNNVWLQVNYFCKEDTSINTLIDKLRNSTQYRESHCLLRTSLLLHTSLSSNTIVSSLAAVRPIYCDRTYLHTYYWYNLCNVSILWRRRILPWRTDHYSLPQSPQLCRR